MDIQLAMHWHYQETKVLAGLMGQQYITTSLQPSKHQCQHNVNDVLLFIFDHQSTVQWH
jgi:hypothetical protein